MKILPRLLYPIKQFFHQWHNNQSSLTSINSVLKFTTSLIFLIRHHSFIIKLFYFISHNKPNELVFQMLLPEQFYPCAKVVSNSIYLGFQDIYWMHKKPCREKGERPYLHWAYILFNIGRQFFGTLKRIMCKENYLSMSVVHTI